MVRRTHGGRITCDIAPACRTACTRIHSSHGNSRQGGAMPSVFSAPFKRLWPATSMQTAQTPPTLNQGEADLVRTPRHLVVLVNGLFGSRANWGVISRLMRSHLDPTDTLIYVSCVNEFRRTYHGIDVCGNRLAEEIRQLTSEAPSLERISFVGHSMGGLISRYAIGDLYDTRTSTVAGLRPCHFIALASPHLGCESDVGPAQVPLIRWSQRLPGLQSLTSALAVPFSSIFFGRSGQQFFLTDRDMGKPPLLYRLAHDCPEEGRFFFSGLAAFETRTLYANRSWDHLVGWSNSSLQHPDVESGTGKYKGRGVVREDPLVWAWDPKDRLALERAINSDCGMSSNFEYEQAHVAEFEDIAGVETPEALVQKEKITAMERRFEAQSSVNMPLAEPTPLPAAGTSSAEFIRAALASLRRLSWRRVDVCFAGGALPLLAHQHMQVQRRWINFDGMATAKHMVLQIEAMERLRVHKLTP